jgi:ribosomal protein L40E
MSYKWVIRLDKYQIMLMLLIIMIVVIAAELAYFMRRRKEKMKLKRSPKGEMLSEKAHNLILTNESISSTLAGQGIDTRNADDLLKEAKTFEARGDYSSAIERAEAAKLALLRAKREQTPVSRPTMQAAQPDSETDAINDEPQDTDFAEEEIVDISKLPKNYMQAKFLLSSAKDLIEKDGITSGDAYDYFQKAKERFDSEDYSKALSFAIKAERMLDSETVDLIGEDEPEDDASEEGDEEVVEVMVCPECDAEVSAEDAFCRSCGQKLEFDTSCPGCEADIEQDDKFCRKCGHQIE